MSYEQDAPVFVVWLYFLLGNLFPVKNNSKPEPTNHVRATINSLLLSACFYRRTIRPVLPHNREGFNQLARPPSGVIG